MQDVLQKVDWNETRRRVELIFWVYRHYRQVFEMGHELGPTKPVYPEYKDYIDPDQIKVPYTISSGAPFGSKPSPRAEMMQGLIEDVEHKVSVLPAYQRELMRLRYMTLTDDEEEPQDMDVLKQLQSLRPTWIYGRRYFYERKKTAMFMLATAFGIVATEQSQ